MASIATPCPRVLHHTPGRIRLHVPDCAAVAPAAVESALRRLPGVRLARMNPHTRNVLVSYDPAFVAPAEVLRCLARPDVPDRRTVPPAPRRDRAPCAASRPARVQLRSRPRCWSGSTPTPPCGPGSGAA